MYPISDSRIAAYRQGKHDMHAYASQLSDGTLTILIEMHQGAISDDYHLGQLIALNDITCRRIKAQHQRHTRSLLPNG